LDEDQRGASEASLTSNGPEGGSLVRGAPRPSTKAAEERRAALVALLREAASVFDEWEIDEVVSQLRERSRER
jgi:hypothetical protein